MVARLRSASPRRKAISSAAALTLVAVAALVYVAVAWANTAVTPGSATSTADQAGAGTYVTVSTITVAEGTNGDWGNGGAWTGTSVVLAAPSGWEFDTLAAPTFVIGCNNTPCNLTAVVPTFDSSTSLTLTLAGSGANRRDNFTISGLSVRATATYPLPPVRSITPSAVNKMVGVTVGSTVFADLTETAGAATELALSGATSSTAGANSVSITATITDDFGNPATRGSDTIITPSSSSTSGSKAFKTTGGSPQATFTITAGTSTVELLYYDETAGSYDLTLTNDGGLTDPAAYPFTVDPAPATEIVLSGPTSGTAGQDSTAFTATLRDQFDNTATLGSDTIITPASSSTSGAKVFKTTGGSPQATFTITAGSSSVAFLYYDETAGSYDVTLTNDSSLTDPAAHPIAVDPGAAAQLAVTSVNGGSDPVAGTPFSVVVRSQDQFGNFSNVSGNTDVALSVATGTGALGGTTTGTLTAGSSNVTITGVTYSTPESGVSLTAARTSGDTLSAGTSGTFTVEAGAVKLAITSPTSASSLTVGSFSVTVEAQDGGGTPAPVAADTDVSLSLTTGSGSLGGTLSGTISAGTSSVTIAGVTYDKAESGVVLTATRTSGDTLTPGDSESLTFDPGPVDHFAVTNTSGGPIGSQTAGVGFDVRVVAQDEFDNTVTGFAGTVDLSSNKTCSAGCTTSAAFDAGVLSTHSLTLTQAAAGDAHVVATKTGDTETGSSNNFTVDAAAATKLALSGPGSVTAGQDSALFTATLQDAFDNTATRGSDTVVTPGSSSGSGLFKTAEGATQATFTIGTGSSSVTFRYYDESAGSYTITLANDSSLTDPAGHGIDVDPAAATAITIGGASSSTAGQNSGSINATLVDPFGNLATRGSDTVITPASSSSSFAKAFKTTGGSTQATFTITSGSSSVSFLYYDESAGSYSITLTNDSSLANPAAHPLTVDADAASQIGLAGPSSLTAGQNSTAFTATLQDQFGNAATRGLNTIVAPASSSGSSSKEFKTTGGTPQVTFTITAGTSTVQFVYYDETAGSYSVALTDDSGLADPAAHPIDVDPAAASKIILSGATSSVAGEDSGLIKATLQDAFDNVATRGSDTVVTPTSTSGTGAFTPQPSFTITAGTSSIDFTYEETTGGDYDITLSNDGGLTNPPAYDFHVYAAHGSGTLAASTSAVSASQTGRTIVFTYTAAAGGMNDGAVRVTVPGGWSAPSTTATAAGYTTASAGTVGVSGQEITVTGVTLAGGATLIVTYGAAPGPGATPSAATGAQSWDAEQRSTSGGALTALASSPAITVHAADGSGTLTAGTSAVAAGSTGNTIAFTYTAASGGMNDGAVRVTVPGGWSAPSTTASAAGFATASAGTVGVSGQEITVTGVTLAGGATLTITYGAAPGPGATAPSSTGAQTWQGAQRSTENGGVSSLGASPSVTVHAANGSGTISVAPDTVTASSAGNELVFTYTAAAGGMNDGAVRIVVPASWTDPAGITTASTGTVGTAGQTITVTGVTLAGGATMTVTYGDGGGVTAPASPESAAWTTSQRSVATGSLVALATQPTVTVEGTDGAGSIAVSPDEVSAGSAQTLTFTYTAGAAGMTDGEIRIAVPSGWSPSATISSGTITLAPGATTDIVYGGTAPSAAGPQTWTVEQKGTSGGTLTELVSGSPAVTVYAGDGTGSIASDTSYVVNGSMPTVEFTYTAAPLAGGMSDGAIEITIPGNWGAPNPIDVSASTGTVGVAGHVITVSEVTLAQAASMTVTLANAAAPTTGGSQTWTTRQASTAAGALTGIASPEIVVSSAPDVPGLVAPVDGATVTPTPTLTATFSDADAANTGTLTFQVCDDSACTSVVDELDASGIENGDDGSVVVPALAEATTYHWRATATDDDGVASAFSATRSFMVDGAGPTISSVEVTESDAASHASGDEVFYRPGASGGTFTVAVDASDSAGVKHVTFPGLAGGSSLDDTTSPYEREYAWDSAFAESGAKTVTAVDVLDNTTGDTFTVTPDSAAPTGGTVSVPQFSSSTSITITSGSYTDAGSGIASNVITRSEAAPSGPGVCGSFTGADVVTSPDTVPADGKCYRYTLTGTDNVGNTTTTSATVLVDTTAPSPPALTLSESAPNLHAAGTTLWFNGGAANGAFTVAATTSDAQSGIGKVAFPAVGAVGSADVASPPYERTYSWTGGEQLGNDVVSHNNAGGTAATPFDLKEDSTAPTGGSISIPDYSGSLTVTIGTTNFGDSGSGIASTVITRADGQDPDSPGVCPAGGYTGATVVTSPDTVPADGKCYRYTLTGTDNVGNADSAMDTVLVDMTPPSQPVLSLSTVSPSVHADNGATPKTVWFKPGTASGDFTVNATTSDDESGVERVAFGAAGSLSAPADHTTEPFQRTYAWASAPTGGTGSVHASNNAGLASTARTFDFTADGTAPTGGSISVQAYSSSTSITIGTTGYADSESGIASNVITRSDGQDPTSPGVCPAGGYTGATVVTSPDAVPAEARCYRYTLTGTDNVGNTATTSATVLVDTTPPTGPGLTVATSSAGVYADDTTKTIWFKPGTATGSFDVTASTSDGQSNIDKVSFPGIAGLDTGGGDVSPPGPFPMSYAWSAAPASSAGNAVTAFNNAGGTSANTFDLGSDGSDPSGGAIGYPDGAQSDSAPDVTVTMPTDGESGLASVTLQQVFHGADCSAPGTPTDVQTVSASGAYNVILTQGFGCYTFQLLAVDNVGNDVTFTSLSEYRLSGATSLETDELTSAGSQHFAFGNLYLNTSTSGSFRLTVRDEVALDVDHVDFPAIPGLTGPDATGDDLTSGVYTWDGTFTSTGVVTVTLHMVDSTTRNEQIQPLADTTDPVASDDTASIGDGWKSSAQTVTLAPDDDGSGVGAVYYTTDGSTPTASSSSGTTVTLNASGVYTIKYFALDNVGNASAVETASTQIRIDLDDPANSFAATAAAPAGTVFVAGTDVWYQGGTAGSFALENTVTDAHSGPASTTFPAFAQANWTAKGAETPTTPAGGPYLSSPFTRTAAASGSFAYAVTSADVAGNGTSTTLTVREDSTAPTTGDDRASIGGGWHSTAQTLTLSPDDGPGSGVGATYFSLDGGETWTQGTSVVLSTTGAYLVTFYSVDNVGNAEAQQTVGPINIDATAPANSVVLFGASPSGSAFLSGGTLFYRGAAPGAFQLRNTITDADSGPGGTTFGAVSAANWVPRSAETVSIPADGPYESSAFSWLAGTSDFPLSVTGLDDAGNTAEAVLTVTNDSDAPVVSDDTASITDAWRNTNATVTLTASDSGSGVATVHYSVSGGAWTQGTSIALGATGVHTIEYYAVDNVGNASAVQSGAAQIRIDKIDPSGAVTEPAAGATLSGSAAQLSASASDTISGVASVRFQVRPAGSMGAFSNAGLPATMPPYDASWDTTTVANGDHELRAFVTDLASNTFATVTRTITVSNVPVGGPAETVIPAGTMTDTVLPVPGTPNTVTVPGGSNAETWVVRTEERLDLESTLPAGSSFGGDIVEVRGCVAGGAGVSTASVDACLATGGTPLTDPPTAWKVSLVGTGIPAKSPDGSGWSELTTEIGDPAEAAGHDESYLATGGGYDLYVKRPSFFALLEPQEGAVALSRPGLAGVVQYGLLKLRWSLSSGPAPLQAYELFVDGKSVRFLGEAQSEEILGPFSPADTRVFEIRAVDIRGRISPLSNAVTSVPDLTGLTVAEARTALAGRGFAGVLGNPSATEGDVVVRQSPAAPILATVGSAVTLVTAGGEGHAALRLQVSNSLRIVLGLHTLNARVALTAPAMVGARLFSRNRFVRTKTGRLVPWETVYKPQRVEAGATIVPFRLPRTLRRPGGYVLLVTARSLSGGAVTRSRTPITLVRPAGRRIVVGQARVEVPVTLVQRSVVTVQLVGKGRIAWRKTWSGRRVKAGTRILSLPLPRSLKRPGAYRLVVTSRAVATGKVTRRQTPVAVVRKGSSQTKAVDVVVLTGEAVAPDTPLKPDAGVKISRADDADEVFTTTSTPSANVQVIVVDVGGFEDVEVIRQLRLVYPDLRIIAVVPQGLGAAARQAGATIAVVKPASPELISTLINQLATSGRP